MSNKRNPNAVSQNQVRNKMWENGVQRGTVLDVFPNAHAVRVNIRGEDNPLVVPVLTPMYGSSMLPKVGSRVTLLYITENTPVVIGAVYLADKESPPDAVAGDIVLGNGSGSEVRINEDGSIDISTEGTQSVDIDAQTATAWITTEQDIAAGNTSIVQYDTVGSDNNSLFTPAENAYTVKHDGLYEIRGAVEIENAGQNNNYRIGIYTNGVETHRVTSQSVNKAELSLTVAEMETLEAGDTVDVRVTNNSGQTRTLAGNKETSTFDIQRVGI